MEIMFGRSKQVTMMKPHLHSRCRSTPTPVLVNLVPDGPISTAIDTNVSTPEPSIDRHLPCVDRHPSQTDPDSLETLRLSKENIYKPKVPYPKSRKSKQEMEEARCKEMMEKRMVQNDVSSEEGALLARDMCAIFLKQTPQSKKEKKKKVFVSEKVNAIIQSKIPEKLIDPGSFVLDCSIFTERFPHSLCDLGSGINLIPYSVAVRLGLTDLKPIRISLILADRSKRIPEGLLEDVLIRIGECIMPTDFVVLKYIEEPQDPIILGRSILTTVGAHIGVQKGTIGLHVGDLVMNFDMEVEESTYYCWPDFSLEEAMDDMAVIEYSEDITARDQIEVLSTDKILEHDVFVLEMRITEANCTKSAETRAAGSVSVDTTSVSIDIPRHDSLNLPKTDGFWVDFNAASLSHVLNRKASPPILQRPRE
ncbi:uncharacterized protein LOC111829948 [Capsella rubella]|uniref:uncharacterized protein LOC111829948 n=1 Tax=Capsella rubella TaxID=81985 RepID=UPI000CD4F28E|nr:uncharacterized protein LOC111829948 [Capsella rubella]